VSVLFPQTTHCVTAQPCAGTPTALDSWVSASRYARRSISAIVCRAFPFGVDGPGGSEHAGATSRRESPEFWLRRKPTPGLGSGGQNSVLVPRSPTTGAPQTTRQEITMNSMATHRQLEANGFGGRDAVAHLGRVRARLHARYVHLLEASHHVGRHTQIEVAVRDMAAGRGVWFAESVDQNHD
jgi:hypothetical protein